MFEGTLSDMEEPTTAALVRIWKYRYQSEPGPMKGGGTVWDLERLARSKRCFGTIYADPPWASDRAGIRRHSHYKRMDLDAIKALPVRDMVSRDAHLWLWTTNAHLPEALAVVEAWGFTYRTMLTWRKPRMGIGWWLRSKTEHVIFAAKTKRRRANPGRVSTVLDAPTRKHSQKPDELYEVIETLSPGPYLELFARGRARRGWAAWGNEVPRKGRSKA